MLDKSFTGVSVSQGTLKTEHLIKSFVEFLDKCDNGKGSALTVEHKARRIVNRAMDDKVIPDSWLDDAQWFLHEVLFDALNEIAPEDCYFGCHPGNGSDIGFWTLEEDC